MPYRPWKFKDGDGERILGLLNPTQNKDDRSPFVRYARSAAMWAEWVREDVVVLDPDIQMPMVKVEGHSFRFALAPLDSLTPLVSVPPSAKDHLQRLLEATQLYAAPIIVCPIGQDRFAVIGNHELYSAAKAYQVELARAGKQRSSDACLVAVCDESFLSNITVRALHFVSDRSKEDIRIELIAAGYADSPRTDDPNSVAVLVGHETFTKGFESSIQWTQNLAVAFGLRSLDFGSNESIFPVKDGQTRVTVSSPKMTPKVLNIGSEFPYGTLAANISPMPGDNMWSLRDFRAE